MAEPARRRGPLDESGADFRRVSGAAVAIEALPFETHLSLRGDAADARFSDAIISVLGVAPSTEVGRVAGTETRLLTLGPDEWLIVAPDASREPLLAHLGAALVGFHHAVVDVSASRAGIGLHGPRARDVLAKGLTLDLHPSVFQAPRCAQSLIARIGVLLEQTDERPAYRVYVRASVAAFLAAWLVDAAEEYEGAIPARS